MRDRILYIVLLFLFSFCTFAQSPGKQDLNSAEEHFDHANYIMALPIFKDELKKDPKNTDLKRKIGICYLRTRINRQEAVKYLEEYTKGPKCDDDAWMDLGRAYMLNNKIDQ